MRRREFVTLAGGAAAAWPLAARAQQQRMRRIGVLMNLAADDPEGPPRVAAFAQGLQEFGWNIGRNVQIDYRWVGGQVDSARRYASELIALAPDLILASGALTVAQLQQGSRTIPIVFVSVTDSIAAGFIESLARPGGNITGFELFENSIGGKWLELLKQIAPQMIRTAVLREPTTGLGQLGAMQSVAPAMGVQLTPMAVRDADEIERGMTAFENRPNGGLIVTATAAAATHRNRIIALAARNRLPAVYPFRYYVADGGLISYGPETTGQFRRAAGYVDRILRGEKPSDLPVQAPVKYETVLNLKTARALGIEVPPQVLVRADEVIE